MESLHSKSYTVTQYLARYFLSIDVGTRILTVTEFLESVDVARGTIQNGLQILKDAKAIQLSSHGKMGTFLSSKNKRVLMSFAGMSFIVGVMPLPYSKLYEGLSSGIIECMSTEIKLPVNMAYMRGAQKRIELVLDGRYDFAIVSMYAAKEFAAKKPNLIQIAADFGSKSYLKGHTLILTDFTKHRIEPGMRVAIDYDSIDQTQLTLNACKGINVTLVPLSYTQFTTSLINKTVDAAIWNADEIDRSLNGLKTVDIEMDTLDNTVAVMVVSSQRDELAKIISESLILADVLKIQNEVCAGSRIPQY